MSRYQPQEKYSEKMVREGFIKVSAWVPAYGRGEILDIAEEMRAESKDPKTAKKAEAEARKFEQNRKKAGLATRL